MNIITTAVMLLLLLLHTTVLFSVLAQHTLTQFGKATQSSIYSNDSSDLGKPENAIYQPITNSFSLSTCSHTSENFGGGPAWWMFQFSFGIAFITNITIYYREGLASRMHGFKLYVTNTSRIPPDGYLCYADPDFGSPDIRQTIPCNQIGKYVIYYDTKGTVHDEIIYGPIVELCYVAINGCQKRFWGSNCQELCSDNCLEQHCYPGNGSCIWGCKTDKCFSNICNRYTAVCTNGCMERRTGSYCDKYNLASDGILLQSPSGSQPANLANDGNKTSCSKTEGFPSIFQVDLQKESIVQGLHITFGESTKKGDNHSIYASNTSSNWKIGIILYQGNALPREVNFNAIFRYITYVPPDTGTVSELEICEIGIIGCPPSHFGHVCNESCPRNCQGPCDLETGKCTFGCLNGWTGEKCDIECRNGKFGRNCSQTCEGCISTCIQGYYGNNCLEICSQFCLYQNCDHKTGNCISGCVRGIKGKHCSQVSLNTNWPLSTHIGLSIGCFFFGVLMTVVVCFFIIKNRQLPNEQGIRKETETTHRPEQQHYDDVELDNISTYQDLQMISKSNEYDGINTAYSNPII